MVFLMHDFQGVHKMTMERFKQMSPNHFSPVDIILEWEKNEVLLHQGDFSCKRLSITDGKIDCEDQCVDKVVLSNITRYDVHLSSVLTEAKRVLKKDGRIYLAVDGRPCRRSFISKLKVRSPKSWKIDKIAEVIDRHGLLIDKNFIINEDEVYLEVINLEGHYLKNRIVI